MGPGSDIEYVGFLEPWDEEVGPLADGLVDYASESVEEDGALAAVDVVEGGADGGGSDAEAHGHAAEVREERH